MQLGLQCLQSGLQKYMSFYNISATLAEQEECTMSIDFIIASKCSWR